MLRGQLKERVIGLLGEEEYDIIAELLNSQLEQMEKTLELADISYKEQQKFDPKKIEKAIDKNDIDEVVDVVAKQFNNRMKNLQMLVLKDSGMSNQEIEEKFL